jgi:micrococcal nuclease
MRALVVAVVASLLVATAEIGAPAHGQTVGEQAYVTRVVDGNVIYAAVRERIEAIRYIGVAVPYIAHPTRGPAPYAGVVLEMNRRLVEGRWIRLNFDAQPRDDDGRLFAYVWVADLFVNAALLYQGFAETERAAVNTRYAAYFQSLEADARRAGRGLWGYADVLSYYRAHAIETGDVGNVDEQPATAAGGRVFSAPNPIAPTLVPTPSALPESLGAGASGGAGRGSGFVPTRPEQGQWPQPGTTYMPAPRMR